MFSRQGGPPPATPPDPGGATHPERRTGGKRGKVVMKRVPVEAERPDRTTATVADAERCPDPRSAPPDGGGWKRGRPRPSFRSDRRRKPRTSEPERLSPPLPDRNRRRKAARRVPGDPGSGFQRDPRPSGTHTPRKPPVALTGPPRARSAPFAAFGPDGNRSDRPECGTIIPQKARHSPWPGPLERPEAVATLARRVTGVYDRVGR